MPSCPLRVKSRLGETRWLYQKGWLVAAAPLVGTWTGTGYEPITTINIRADHTGNFVGGQSFTWQLSGDHLFLVLDSTKDNEDFLFKWTDPNTKTDFTMVSHYGAGDLGRFHKSNAKLSTRKYIPSDFEFIFEAGGSTPPIRPPEMAG